MKYALIGLIAIILTGCGSDNIPSTYDNRILYDKDGCAFIVKHNVGDNMFLNYLKEVSKPECKFVLED